MSDESEDKICYDDGQGPTVLRGHIVKEDDVFIYISRRDGEYRISKKIILKIERKGGGKP